MKINQRLLDGLSEIEKLKDNWDSYGAKTPSLETIEKAKKIISIYPEDCQPEIYPENDGSIELSWKVKVDKNLI